MMKNAFYFILKALFVPKIFKFLSWLFGHVEKTTWFEQSHKKQQAILFLVTMIWNLKLISKFMTSQPD